MNKKKNKEHFDNQYISDIYSMHKNVDSCDNDNGYIKSYFDYKKPFQSFCIKKSKTPTTNKNGFITNLKKNLTEDSFIMQKQSKYKGCYRLNNVNVFDDELNTNPESERSGMYNMKKNISSCLPSDTTDYSNRGMIRKFNSEDTFNKLLEEKEIGYCINDNISGNENNFTVNGENLTRIKDIYCETSSGNYYGGFNSIAIYNNDITENNMYYNDEPGLAYTRELTLDDIDNYKKNVIAYFPMQVNYTATCTLSSSTENYTISDLNIYTKSIFQSINEDTTVGATNLSKFQIYQPRKRFILKDYSMNKNHMVLTYNPLHFEGNYNLTATEYLTKTTSYNNRKMDEIIDDIIKEDGWKYFISRKIRNDTNLSEIKFLNFLPTSDKIFPDYISKRGPSDEIENNGTNTSLQTFTGIIPKNSSRIRYWPYIGQFNSCSENEDKSINNYCSAHIENETKYIESCYMSAITRVMKPENLQNFKGINDGTKLTIEEKDNLFLDSSHQLVLDMYSEEGFIIESKFEKKDNSETKNKKDKRNTINGIPIFSVSSNLNINLENKKSKPEVLHWSYIHDYQIPDYQKTNTDEYGSGILYTKEEKIRALIIYPYRQGKYNKLGEPNPFDFTGIINLDTIKLYDLSGNQIPIKKKTDLQLSKVLTNLYLYKKQDEFTQTVDEMREKFYNEYEDFNTIISEPFNLPDGQEKYTASCSRRVKRKVLGKKTELYSCQKVRMKTKLVDRPGINDIYELLGMDKKSLNEHKEVEWGEKDFVFLRFNEPLSISRITILGPKENDNIAVHEFSENLRIDIIYSGTKFPKKFSVEQTVTDDYGSNIEVNSDSFDMEAFLQWMDYFIVGGSETLSLKPSNFPKISAYGADAEDKILNKPNSNNENAQITGLRGIRNAQGIIKYEADGTADSTSNTFTNTILDYYHTGFVGNTYNKLSDGDEEKNIRIMYDAKNYKLLISTKNGNNWSEREVTRFSPDTIEIIKDNVEFNFKIGNLFYNVGNIDIHKTFITKFYKKYTEEKMNETNFKKYELIKDTLLETESEYTKKIHKAYEKIIPNNNIKTSLNPLFNYTKERLSSVYLHGFINIQMKDTDKKFKFINFYDEGSETKFQLIDNLNELNTNKKNYYNFEIFNSDNEHNLVRYNMDNVYFILYDTNPDTSNNVKVKVKGGLKFDTGDKDSINLECLPYTSTRDGLLEIIIQLKNSLTQIESSANDEILEYNKPFKIINFANDEFKIVLARKSDNMNYPTYRISNNADPNSNSTLNIIGEDIEELNDIPASTYNTKDLDLNNPSVDEIYFKPELIELASYQKMNNLMYTNIKSILNDPYRLFGLKDGSVDFENIKKNIYLDINKQFGLTNILDFHDDSYIPLDVDDLYAPKKISPGTKKFT